MSDVHDASYYGKCMVGGIFACGITHAAVCPLDIVKCRRQVSLLCPFSAVSAALSFVRRKISLPNIPQIANHYSHLVG